MMKDYHIGSLDEDGRAALAQGEPQANDDNTETSPTFLTPRAWKKAILMSKNNLSWDTRVFSFRLDHDSQTLGLPVGQHLFIRLQDPATRETIIRSYTPISETSKNGVMEVVVKVYFDSKERKGGKMSQALDALPTGHFVEFKGPIGKFEYLGNGRCAVNNVERIIKTFIMICAGTGITPIYQVLRAIMQDATDTTKCVVLDGNRLQEDILCREGLDFFAQDHQQRCKIFHTLTQGPDDWTGLRGRVAAPLLREQADCKAYEDGKTMVLICGPEAFEQTVHQSLLEIGWKEGDLLFF